MPHEMVPKSMIIQPVSNTHSLRSFVWTANNGFGPIPWKNDYQYYSYLNSLGILKQAKAYNFTPLYLVVGGGTISAISGINN